jgi:UDPglucose--hexose-1-phosphate uridylyltransferase
VFSTMAEFRRDPLLGNWVVLGFKKTKTNIVGVCPFCPGNESMTPPPIREVRDSEGAWVVRCFSAANPVLQIEASENKRAEGFYDKMGTVGADELIVENRSHAKTLSAFDPVEMSPVFDMYVDRMIDLKKDPRFKHVQVFKNHGELAGSYIFHPHSHVLAAPIVPHQISMELTNSRNHYVQKERCLLCDVVSQEIRQERRIVAMTDHFLVLSPFASRVAFEVWIIPRRHNPTFESGLDEVIRKDLIDVFLDTMKRIEKVAGSYSMVIHTSPNMTWEGTNGDTPQSRDYFHWHIEILPRDFNSSKFKREDQFYTVSITPEEAAALLKSETV